ncbi:hypothetical protein ABFS82_03G053300 [Erythranthe guttata]|uniref:probable E3 ubiquitin-protein ligase ARI2 n=1 Tax=Erythranthe guttata TaxID=4155 RepID=UPI00064DD839|nr:PREDICTED: probable E3 ubiquitin-protein ligase ARI2 [Erythranthe guttata]XP_012845594.1 PREDICTED: probable E3 ubiquitin-protein ligase ARI2 [Erythranthe guttata]|eukprot:XP_012845587.1 PREDICTED: probable E3 ubiquitin-protein ligase ARI2 [Erythranthe guttata]
MEEDDYDYGFCSDDEEFDDRVDEDEGAQSFAEVDGDCQFSLSNGGCCKVIRKESLLAAQKGDVQRVMNFLSVKEHHARTLLIHYRWDVDKVCTVFVEKGKEQLYAEAGVLAIEGGNISSSHCSTERTCLICFDEFHADKMTTMDCGHCFCDECWTEHFIVKTNEGQSRRITCMADKCYTICDEGSIRNLLSARDPQLAQKFDRVLLESYIEDNKSVQWCPSVPHCGNAIRADKDEICEVECACGLQFCFGCSSEAHSPCSCKMWESWTRKCSDESETVNWMQVNTKFCPKCHKPVEKNGGCNLVYCVCKQAFCWLCGGATGTKHTWTSIEGHECGRYSEKQVKETESARNSLWRYTHYYQRYKAHMDSLKAEKNGREELQKKISALESRKLESKYYFWVSEASSRLTRSRQILCNSYPFAYYMFGDELFQMTSDERTINQNLFENQQQQLETNVERLSMALEDPFDEYDDEDVLEARLKAVNLGSTVDVLCKKLYECIENELLEGVGADKQAIHKIAPYNSNGVEKASEIGI